MPPTHLSAAYQVMTACVPTAHLPPATYLSKDVLQAQLNLSGRPGAVFICRLDLAKCWGPEGVARNIEMRDIQHVKELSTKLEPTAFVAERDILK